MSIDKLDEPHVVAFGPENPEGKRIDTAGAVEAGKFLQECGMSLPEMAVGQMVYAILMLQSQKEMSPMAGELLQTCATQIGMSLGIDNERINVILGYVEHAQELAHRTQPLN